ncbi:RRP12-like protein [Amphibalanus amphitrite]|uniref:RRP12-like protein n=1 Tax=Amphibalanus amphitrite TaxID=1232801 RepID=UPI001C91C3D1|nr:RRP12-like protein [Amphibalanus amphitrite]XP_043216715.1 RRP12-like protein [Amphibalanus amphitrite]
MGKVHIRQKGRNKAYRWAKGHSSDSNPPLKKFRQNAQAGFFQPLGEPKKGGLTTDALSKHDAVLGVSELRNIEDVVEEDQEDALSEGALTLGSLGQASFRTFATDFTQCTVPSFSKLLTTVRKDSPIYNEMLAILAAVTEVVKEKEGQETVTEYFGALMSVLESTEEEGVQLQAVCQLLSLGIRHTPRPVLISKFSLCSKLLMARLEAVMATGTVLLIKSLLECLAVLLRAQPAATWAEPSTLQMYSGVLSFVIHTRPKVRRAGQRAVISTLLGSACMRQDEESPAHHPAAATTAQFCRQQMEQCGGAGRAVTTLHVLTLLRAVLHTFPRQQLKAVIETMLKLMTLASPLVKRSCLQALQAMLVNSPDRQTLPPAMNAQLVSALYDYQPPVGDAAPLVSWLSAMHAAHTCLYGRDQQLGAAHLPRFFAAAAACWASSKPEVRTAVTEALSGLIDAVVAELDADGEPAARTCFQSLMDGLQFQYVDAWPLVLRTLSKFFTSYGARCRPFVGPSLVTLAELRDTEQFTYTAELEAAIGAAVSAVGPRTLLEHVPLRIAGDESDDPEFSRSWLLPVLRAAVRDTELAFFAEYFLPLARALKTHAQQLEQADDRRMCRIYNTLELQVWDLLPGFCTGALDVPDSLKRVARALGSLLTEREDLRLVVLSALRLLATKSSDDEASRAEVARFAKNYLPILFNLYMTLPSSGPGQGHRAAVLETVTAYLTVADHDLIKALVDKALEKVGAGEPSDEDRAHMLDLLRTMLPHMEADVIARVWGYAGPFVEGEQRLSQKTAYRLLEDVCQSQHQGCITFVQENHMDLMSALKRSMASASASAKTTRLSCLAGLLEHLDGSSEHFVAGVLPEAVLCCKEHNEKSRAAAFRLIVRIGETLRRWASEAGQEPEEAMRTYMKMLLAGLTGSPKLIAGTLLATAQVIHQFKEIFPADLLDLTLDNVCLLMTSSSREPAEACLSLVKALVFAIDPAVFARFLPRLMKAIAMMTPDCKRHFRQKTRDLLAVFVRKFGFDVIFGLAPSGDAVLQKRLKNIKKVEQRKKADREARRQQQESDDELAPTTKSVDEILQAAEVSSDEDEGGRSEQQRPARRKANSAAWIREDAESIVDLLDPKASRQVTASRPDQGGAGAERRERRRKEFGISEDGRLIIDTGDDDDDEPIRSSDDEEDEPDQFLEAIRNTAGHRAKRKLDACSAGSASEPAPASKYRAGGGGIHRPVGGAESVRSGRSHWSTAGASVRSGRSARSAGGGPPARVGAEYASKKGRGDVKRAGRPDPYAYVPLKRNTLNKRKKAKYEGQYKNIVSGAQKGATKGAKARGRSRKR